MTPQDFIAKWRLVELKERSASQSHCYDLCRLPGVDDPVKAGPNGEWFTFGKRAAGTSGGTGWSDVWHKDYFGRENRGGRCRRDRVMLHANRTTARKVGTLHPPGPGGARSQRPGFSAISAAAMRLPARLR